MKLTEVYVAVLEGDGEEDVLTIGPENESLPIAVIGDAGLAGLREYAQAYADSSGRIVSIICFSSRGLCDTLLPTYNRR